MNNAVKFFNRNDDEFNVINLLQHSLTQMKMYYEKQMNEDNYSLDYKKNDDFNFISLLLATSYVWIDDMIEQFNMLGRNEVINIKISENDFQILKYIVDFCWNTSLKENMDFPDNAYYFLETINKKEEKTLFLKIIK